METLPETCRPAQPSTHEKVWIVLLDDPTHNPFLTFDIVQKVCGHEEPRYPLLQWPNGSAKGKEACIVSQHSLSKILEWILTSSKPDYKLKWSWALMAAKELSETSAYPTLGLDPTLPQNRPSSTTTQPRDTLLIPAPNTYPVYYFLSYEHGRGNWLAQVLGSTTLIKLCARARVRGALSVVLEPKNPLLVPAPPGEWNGCVVPGICIIVEKEWQEIALRFLKGYKHSFVARCKIELENRQGQKTLVKGLTFQCYPNSIPKSTSCLLSSLPSPSG